MKQVNTDDCWLWAGVVTPDGYARISFRQGVRLQRFYAHRVMYELQFGPIPQGLVVDHLCRNRSCINPHHLEPVTNAENLRRGVHINRFGSSRKTQCIRGHDYNDKNTYIKPDGTKACRVCRRTKLARS